MSDTGVDHGNLLVAFSEAVIRQSADVATLRSVLLAELGAARGAQTIATIAAFSGLVRVADSTGIPIDDGLAAASTDLREQLALDTFGGAANTDLGSVGATPFTTIDALFSTPAD